MACHMRASAKTPATAMDLPDPTPAKDGELCHMSGCERRAIVWLGGRALCAQHYIYNVNEVNDLGLTPRNLAGGDDADVPATHREQPRISHPVEPPRTPKPYGAEREC